MVTRDAVEIAARLTGQVFYVGSLTFYAVKASHRDYVRLNVVGPADASGAVTLSPLPDRHGSFTDAEYAAIDYANRKVKGNA